jgi:hypothetical protein
MLGLFFAVETEAYRFVDHEESAGNRREEGLSL